MHADAAHLLGVEVGIVVIATPARIIGLCYTSIAVWVYCAIVSVLASCFFFEAFQLFFLTNITQMVFFLI